LAVFLKIWRGSQFVHFSLLLALICFQRRPYLAEDDAISSPVLLQPLVLSAWGEAAQRIKVNASSAARYCDTQIVALHSSTFRDYKSYEHSVSNFTGICLAKELFLNDKRKRGLAQITGSILHLFKASATKTDNFVKWFYS
jgi:hypothetical protein